jgi:hypothetical protein
LCALSTAPLPVDTRCCGILRLWRTIHGRNTCRPSAIAKRKAGFYGPVSGLDRLDLTPAATPQCLIRHLFELDADYAEALWGLDQPTGELRLRAMLRDTSLHHVL